MASKSKSSAYVREWMQSVGLKQSDLVKQLDWSKAKANAVWHGEQRYNEDMLGEVATLVNAEIYELLMPPEDAHRLRRLRAVLDDANTPPPAATPAASPVVSIRRRKAS